MKEAFVDFEVDGTTLRIATMTREGQRAPIVFLHGFGSTKEDYADIARYPQFDGHSVIAFDAPGCGVSECADLSTISIPFLKQVAERIVAHYSASKFHLVGHSMGGLTALLLAHSRPSAVLSFTNIEGNLLPEDCFLSRQVIEHTDDDPERFMASFVARTRRAPEYSSGLFASSLPYKVRAEAVAPIFRSMVKLTEHGELLDKFLKLPLSRMFMYGDDNRSLTYLRRLQDHDVQLAKIQRCGHFPMYANPLSMWNHIGSFIEQTEVGVLSE